MLFGDFTDIVKDQIFIPDYVFFQAIGRTQSTLNLIHRWRREGKLVRLKRGLYILGARYKTRSPNLNFQAANILISPSYVSLDAALSYHGMIPEKIVETTSVCLKRPKRISNPLGIFSYARLNKTAYPHGVVSEGGPNSFLIACREKALLDKIYFFHAERTFKMSYLFDSLRIEEDDIGTCDFGKITEFAKLYGTKKMIFTAETIRNHYGA